MAWVVAASPLPWKWKIQDHSIAFTSLIFLLISMSFNANCASSYRIMRRDMSSSPSLTNASYASCVPSAGITDICSTSVSYIVKNPNTKLGDVATLFNTDVLTLATTNAISSANPLPINSTIRVPLACYCVPQLNAIMALVNYTLTGYHTADDITSYFFEGLSTLNWTIPLNPNASVYALRPGNVLVVPINCSCPLLLGSALRVQFVTYVIQEGDTLVAIAAKFNTTEVAIMKVNDIPYPQSIYPGDIYRIPLNYIPASSPPPPSPAPSPPPSPPPFPPPFPPPEYPSPPIQFPPLNPPPSPSSPASQPPPPAASAAPSNSSTSPSPSSLENIYIAVIVVGVFLILSAIAFLAICICCRPRKLVQFGPKLSQSKLLHRSSALHRKLQEQFVKPIPWEEIEEATDHFSEERKLGSGGYGTVYRGIGPNSEAWAVKRAKVQNLSDFQNEVNVISKMSHRHLVRLLGWCDENDEQILVYEYVENGTLKQHLRPKSDPSADIPSLALTFEQRLEIAVGSAWGLHYLHSFAKPAIIHRDIKSDNILIDINFQAKVADFGLFNYVATDPEADMTPQVAGTPGYIDPEFHHTMRITAKSDVYSFGVVLLELITGKPPVMKDEAAEQDELSIITLGHWAMPAILSQDHKCLADPRMEGKYDPEALLMMAEVARMCLQLLGSARPEMAEVARRLSEIQDSILRSASGQGSSTSDSIQSGDTHFPTLFGAESLNATDSRMHYEPMSIIRSGR